MNFVSVFLNLNMEAMTQKSYIGRQDTYLDLFVRIELGLHEELWYDLTC